MKTGRARTGLGWLAVVLCMVPACSPPVGTPLPETPPKADSGISWEFPADWTFTSLTYEFVSGVEKLVGELVPEGPQAALKLPELAHRTWDAELLLWMAAPEDNLPRRAFRFRDTLEFSDSVVPLPAGVWKALLHQVWNDGTSMLYSFDPRADYQIEVRLPLGVSPTNPEADRGFWTIDGEYLNDQLPVVGAQLQWDFKDAFAADLPNQDYQPYATPSYLVDSMILINWGTPPVADFHNYQLNWQVDDGVIRPLASVKW